MITATVRYKLPPQIHYAACREQLHKIAPGFREVKGLIARTSSGAKPAGPAVYTNGRGWRDATAFYSGPWFDGIVQRYGMHPHIDFCEVFAATDNARGTVRQPGAGVISCILTPNPSLNSDAPAGGASRRPLGVA